MTDRLAGKSSNAGSTACWVYQEADLPQTLIPSAMSEAVDWLFKKEILSARLMICSRVDIR